MSVDTEVKAPRESHATRWLGRGTGYLLKLALMALVNALGLTTVLAAWRVESWGIMAGSILLLVIVDVIYFAKRSIPAKYLTPGLIFLVIFQVFAMIYTGFIAFTNYGTAHNVSKEQAIEILLTNNERKVEGTSSYPLTIVERGTELGFAITDDGAAQFGTETEPLAPAPDATISDNFVTALPGWEVIATNRLFSDNELAAAIEELRVPVSEDPNEGSVRASNFTTAVVYRSVLHYDEAADTMTNLDTGTVYYAGEDGYFRAEDGSILPTGWRVNVGFDNFVRAFSGENTEQLAYITVWNFVFAILTVASSFFLGLIMAIIYNDQRIRGRKVWRTVFILPYAFPAFLSALLWRGMFNARYGIINDWFFDGAYIQWLADPMLAKFTILFVNLWLSYPYWFLICTGALQALNTETLEAARIDGGGPFRVFRSIQLPLLLVATAPLLIASFAFNFNNFTVIYMLTNGDPKFPDATIPLGQTDILITAIFRISGVAAGSSATADYGLASALSIIVFIVIGAISALAFRQTKKLEEVS